MSDTERSEDQKRRRRRRGRSEVSEREIRDPGDLTPKPVLGDVPTTTKPPGRDLAGTAVRATDPKLPTEDVDAPYVRSAKAVIDESNKIVKDAVGDGWGGSTPRNVAAIPPHWKAVAGDVTRPPEVKPPTDDLHLLRPPSAKAVFDENNKLVNDTVGLGGSGATPPSPLTSPGVGTPGVSDPAATVRRPFVLGTPHHAAGAAALAGADPSALAVAAGRAAEGDPADETTINAAILDASLAQVETAIRVMKRDLESLEEYYRELAAHRDELEPAHEDERDEDETEAAEE